MSGDKTGLVKRQIKEMLKGRLEEMRSFKLNSIKLNNLNSKGSAATITVLIFSPILIGMVLFAYVASATTQSDQTISSAALNAARAAVVCCGDAADAAVVAENIVRSTLRTNSIPCRNLGTATSENPVVRVEFIREGPTSNNPRFASGFALISTVNNPRSSTPANLRQQLGDSLAPGVLVRVSVYCELSFQNLVGLWVPFASTTRVESATAIVDPFISQ